MINASLFQTIFATSPLGINLLDLEGNIIQTNLAMGEILGSTPEELQGKNIFQFTYFTDLHAAERLFRDLISGTARNCQLDQRYITRRGSIVWTHIFYNRVENEKGEPVSVLSLVENVSIRKELEADLFELRSRMLDNTEKERLRLAQELHDGPMQDLHSIQYQIEAFRPALNARAQMTLGEISHTVQSVLEALRSTTKDLRPPAITDFGLANAIRSHVADLEDRHPEITIQLLLEERQDLLPQRVRLALFRIFQAGMMNTIVHSQASTATVHLAQETEKTVLEIKDNGIGFDVPDRWINLVRKGHYGLAGAAERVEALQGDLTVHSKPGEGTILRVVIPIAAYEEGTNG